MKKTLACLMAALFLFSAFSVAGVADNTCDCGHPPVVFVNGFTSSNLVLDRGTENATVVYPYAGDAIKNLILDHKEALWDTMDTRFTPEAEQEIVDAIKDLLKYTEMTDEGESLYNVTADYAYTTNPAHSDGQHFNFSYDWRQDPFVSAEELNDFIAYVKELTGHDSVNLIGFSQGGTVLSAYLAAYGYDGVASVIWCCGAQAGTSIVGSLFAGGLSVDADIVTNYVHSATEDSFGFNLLSCLLQSLKDIGLTGSVLRITNNILQQFYEDGAIRDIMLASFGKMPGMWCMVPDEYYEAAKQFMFGEGEDAAPYAALIEKIDRYHNEVTTNFDAIVEGVRENGGKVAVIANYNGRMLPFTAASNQQADSVIDTHNASLGATCADFGKTLGDDYVQQIDDGHNHLSADGVIDASTALCPDYTWFVKNAGHSFNDALVRFILESDHQPDVFENENFPQFSYYSPATGTTTPLTKDTDERPDMKFIERVIAFFQKILTFWRQLFDKMFKA